MRIGSFGEVRRRSRVYGPLPLSGGGGSGGILKPQDVFATVLAPANTMQAAINALAFSPDLLIDKDRAAATDWSWRDSLTGLSNTLASNTTAAQAAFSGYSGTNGRVVQAIKRAAKVLDIVPYTGDGTSNHQIPHGLSIPPGAIATKSRVGAATGWPVAHRSLNASQDGMFLNTTAAKAGSTQWAGVFSATQTDTYFTVGAGGSANAAGVEYTAYLFAHDPDPVNGIVQCGTGNVTLPWALQWLLYKDAGASGNWSIIDSTRGFTLALNPNLPAVEAAAVGATVSGSTVTFSGMTTPVWCAIRAAY